MMPTHRPGQLGLLVVALLLSACGSDDPIDARDPRTVQRPAPAPRGERTMRPVAQGPDTAVYVARQAGHEFEATSAVMQLRVNASDAQVTLENEAGQQAVAAAPGAESAEEIPGSRAVTEPVATPPGAAPSWKTSVSIPVLEGERYLVEFFPTTARRDSARLDLSADDTRLLSTSIPVDVTSGDPALFEVAVGRQGVTVSPQIEKVEIVPTCGTTHVIRSGGRADLYAQYAVLETGEEGDVHLPPRDADAKFRSVTLKTKTRGTLQVSYLSRELASAAVPEACPAP